MAIAHGIRSKVNMEKKRKKRKKFLILLPIIIAVLFGGFFYYAFSAEFHITEVKVSGSSFAKKEEIELTVKEILSRELWGFIPRKSSLLIGAKLIEETLYATYPPIKEVELNIQGHTMVITIRERTATSVICTVANSCYFMDNEGLAFASAPKFEGSSFIKIKTYDTSINAGTSVISKDELEEVVKKIALFKSLMLSAQYVSFISEKEMEFIGPGGTVFVMMRKDGSALIEERLKALLSSRPDIVNGTYEYVDLRIDSKIFLKNRE